MTLPLACLLFTLSAAAARFATGPFAGWFSGYLTLHFALTVAMLLAWACDRGTRRDLAWLTGAGTVSRLLLVGAAGASSSDSTRYLWDGAVLLAGVDPWTVSPNDLRLPLVSTGWPFPPVHAGLPTVYPPGAIAAFAAAAATGPRHAPLAWQAMVSVAGIATVLVVASSSRRHVALAALSPLLVLETGIGRHVDALATLGVAAAVALVRKPAPAAAGAALAVAASMKPLTLAALPAIVALAPAGPARLWTFGTLVGTLGAAYATAAATGLRPLGSLPEFLRSWRVGSPIHALASAVGGEPSAWAVATALVAGGAWVSMRLARRRLAGAAISVALGTALAASPVVFPWYLMPLVPAAALAPSATIVTWLSTVPLVYEVEIAAAATGAWSPAAWPMWVVSAAVAVAALGDVMRYRRG